MLTKDELFQTGDQQRIWQKYCGFLDLSLTEFMEIQEHLLTEQIELVYDSPLAKKFMPKKPKDITEFRQLVPLTTFDDYAAYLNEKNEDVLAVKPYCWAHTSGRGGTFKWVPFTPSAMEWIGNGGTAMAILACANRKGEVNIKSGLRALHNLPPAPYFAGIMAPLLAEKIGARLIPPPDKYENVDFAVRTQAGFQIAMRTGVDFLTSLTSVLIKIGERFTESSGQLKFNRHMLQPSIMLRLVMAWLRSKRARRALLPKDLWPLKGLMCYGMDTNIYREQLIRYWGKEPLEVYVATESGVIATQAWNKKGMTCVPFCSFLEFIPEVEWLKSRDDKDYRPSTVLLDEVKPGESYEIIITSLWGMPFLRYRLGDIIKVVALEDTKAGIKLPQIVFGSRTADLIDIAGFTRLDEKTVWQAIANTGIKYEDWCIRKEYEQDKPIMHLYIELKQEMKAQELERVVHQKLADIDHDYRDLESMLGIRPLRVSLLPAGSFQQYYEEKQRAGADLAHLKPPHMNPSDAVIKELINLK